MHFKHVISQRESIHFSASKGNFFSLLEVQFKLLYNEEKLNYEAKYVGYTVLLLRVQTENKVRKQNK